VTRARAQRHPSPRPLLALAALFSGAALVASIITEISLALTLALLATAAVLTVALKWSLTEPRDRPLVKAQLMTGIAAGIAATATYDLTRLLLTELGQLDFYPFETFKIFGQLILGESAPKALTFAVGTTYHLLNGVAFAVSYCFLLGGRNWKYGILWALGLEAAMLAIYPGWLDLEAVMQEFVTVSVLGHVAYGTTLGVVSQERLKPDQFAGASPPAVGREDQR
jgi:hypothetical protein